MLVTNQLTNIWDELKETINIASAVQTNKRIWAMVTDSFEYCFPDEFGYIVNTQLPGIDNTLNNVMVEAFD